MGIVEDQNEVMSVVTAVTIEGKVRRTVLSGYDRETLACRLFKDNTEDENVLYVQHVDVYPPTAEQRKNGYSRAEVCLTRNQFTRSGSGSVS